MSDLAAILDQLDAAIAAIKKFPDPRRATAEWKQAYALIKKTSAAGNHADNVVARRDLPGLEAITAGLRPKEPGAAAEPVSTIDDATLASAMKAFRRRLKLVKLDDESAIDLRDPTSKGGPSQITAIEAPRDFPPEVWAELVTRGQLRRAGAGIYELVGT